MPNFKEGDDMAENLGIRIMADIDKSESVKSINRSLKQLSSMVDKLDLDIDFKGFANEFNNAVKKMDTGNIKEEMQGSFDLPVEKIKKQSSVIGKQIKELEKQYGGTVSKVSRNMNFDGDKSEIKDFTVTLEKANKEMTKLKLSPSLDDHNKLDIISAEETQDIKAARKETEKLENEFRDLEDAQEKYIKNIEKMRIKGNITNEDADVLTDSVQNKQSIKELEKLDLVMEELKQSQNSLNKERREEIQLQTQRDKKEKSYSNWWNKALKEQEVKQERVNESEEERTRNLKHQIELAQKQARLNVQKLTDRNSKFIDSRQADSLDRYVQAMERIDTTTPRAREQIQSLNHEFKRTSSEIQTASQRAMGFGAKFKEAITSIPIWMAGMTALYAPIRGVSMAVEQVQMLDSAMVDLKRVMDATPQTYNRMMEESISLSESLGNKVSEVSKAMVEWSRQGFSPDETLNLTRTSTIASNISEMNTVESMDTLTAAMTAFNIEAKDSISIIDRLNEVDNNFAIDTQKLSNALMKSSSVSNEFGVSLENLIGYISAIGITTRESGQVIGRELPM